ncbi:Peptidyl-prolyl cis-trans isomerase-like 2 [Metarhizium anisopliae]
MNPSALSIREIEFVVARKFRQHQVMPVALFSQACIQIPLELPWLRLGGPRCDGAVGIVEFQVGFSTSDLTTGARKWRRKTAVKPRTQPQHSLRYYTFRWSSSDAYSASAGAKSSSLSASGAAPFRRLPFNFCAASLQPFKNPVCTSDGTIFDVEVISAWLEKHPNQNPVNGEPLHKKDLIRLNFARNATSDSLGAGLSDGKGDLIDPVTYKIFTDNTHIVAIRHGTYANVFAWETVERMNIKAKLWQDLVDDEPFSRADIITLQILRMPLVYIKDGEGAQLTREQEEERNAGGINAGALGSMGDKVLKAKAAVEKARKAREAGGDVNRSSGALTKPSATSTACDQEQKLAANAAAYTTGKAAASFTSTGLTPETSGERALLTDEEFMLKPKRVKTKGYARIETNLAT